MAGAMDKKVEKRLWNDAENDYLRQSYGKIPSAEIARCLGRTIRSVTTRGRRLGLSGRHSWPKSEGTKRKLREAMLGRRYAPEVNKRKGKSGEKNPFYNRHHTEETKQKLRLINLGKRYSPEVNSKKGLKGELNPAYGKQYHNPRAGIPPEEARRLWKDPAFVRKIMAARNSKPNKKERLLARLLEERYPGEWWYTGDGKDGTTIGGRIPDFTNSRGRGAVIELFGEYWHIPLVNPKVSWNRTAEATREHYRRYGLDCIIIWESELDKPDTVFSRIGGE